MFFQKITKLHLCRMLLMVLFLMFDILYNGIFI